MAPDVVAHLVRRAQGGTGPELDELLAALRPTLYAYYARRVDGAAADDLAQRTLLIVAREYRRLDPLRAARWLVTIARNLVRDEFRRSARAAGRFVPAEHASALPVLGDADRRVEFEDLASAVLGAARTTCSAPLHAVVCGIVRGLDVDEIARALGVSEQAVRVRLTRARAQLREALAPLRASQSRASEGRRSEGTAARPDGVRPPTNRCTFRRQ